MQVQLTVVALIIGFVSYVPYLRNLIKGNTKPHAFTSFIWGLLTAIAFVAQISEGAGIAALATGAAALFCFIVFGFGLKYGKHNIVPADWIFLLMALIAVVLWVTTDDPTSAVILITIADMLAFIPTFRKSWRMPYEETISTYALSSLKFILAIAALQTFNLATVLYPLSLVVTNAIFVIFVMYRRNMLNTKGVQK